MAFIIFFLISKTLKLVKELKENKYKTGFSMTVLMSFHKFY